MGLVGYATVARDLSRQMWILYWAVVGVAAVLAFLSLRPLGETPALSVAATPPPSEGRTVHPLVKGSVGDDARFEAIRLADGAPLLEGEVGDGLSIKDVDNRGGSSEPPSDGADDADNQ